MVISFTLEEKLKRSHGLYVQDYKLDFTQTICNNKPAVSLKINAFLQILQFSETE